MIPVDKAVIARAKRYGHNFEVFVEPEKAKEFRKDPTIDIEEVIAARDVFSDSSSGKRANDDDLKEAFGTTDFREVLLKILKHGDIQLTTEQKRKMAEQKTKQIITVIARGAVDPRSHTPHPRERIERMIEENHIHIDPLSPVQEQVRLILDQLKKHMPITMERDKIFVNLKAEDATRLYGLLKEYNLSNEKWQSDGSLEGVVEMPAGQQGEFYDKLNKSAKFHVETKILERT